MKKREPHYPSKEQPQKTAVPANPPRSRSKKDQDLWDLKTEKRKVLINGEYRKMPKATIVEIEQFEKRNARKS